MSVVEERSFGRHKWLIGLLAGVVTLVVSSILLVSITRGNHRPLKPIRPTATPADTHFDGEAVLVTFDELNNNPDTFRNRRIRVSGNYTPLTPPTCVPHNGPVVRWALVSDNLQLDALGFESVVRMVPADIPFVVEGIWRMYQGPLGCGKEPPSGEAWYLEVTQILQPNPLVNAQNEFVGGRPGEPEIAASARDSNGQPGLPTPTPTPEETATTATITTTPPASPSPSVTPTTAGSVTASPSATPTVTQAGVTPPPTPDGTAPGVTATLTPTPTGTAVPGATEPPPATPTTTNGYPAPPTNPPGDDTPYP